MPTKFDLQQIPSFDSNTKVVSSNKISGMDNISADSGDFKDVRIEGNLEVKGILKAKEIDMDESRIVLNFDYEYIEEKLEHMDSDDLKHFMKHLEKLKLLTEKKLLDRS